MSESKSIVVEKSWKDLGLKEHTWVYPSLAFASHFSMAEADITPA